MNLSAGLVRALLDHAYATEGPRTWHITRLAMYRALSGAWRDVDGPDRTCLAISRSVRLAREILGLRAARMVEANYPKHDMVALRFPDGAFDFCVSDQVLEHVAGNPIRAVQESARVVKPGGLVCHTTCFINEIHGAPQDFWRFTPGALALMAREAGLEPLMIGGWGNRDAVPILNSDLRLKGIPDDPDNPVYQLALHNEPDWPISVWLVARKPGGDAQAPSAAAAPAPA